MDGARIPRPEDILDPIGHLFIWHIHVRSILLQQGHEQPLRRSPRRPNNVPSNELRSPAGPKTLKSKPKCKQRYRGSNTEMLAEEGREEAFSWRMRRVASRDSADLGLKRILIFLYQLYINTYFFDNIYF